jgi:eukaryotic-like serine/threonine-protein kinase
MQQCSPTSPSGGPTQSVPALPAQPRPSSTTEVAPTTTPGVSGGPQDTPEQLQGAITDYYALVPGNLPAAWNRLTANYQQNHAGGFTGYQNFWSPVQRVTVVDVSARQGDAVDATIDYFFKDGRVIEEQTSYGLVTEDGLWKIDSSTVHGSQTK